MAASELDGDPMSALGAHQYLPKSRKRTKAGRYSHEITYEELSQYFHLPTEKACQKLGVGLTILKRICRRFGLPRWPYRKPSKALSGIPSIYPGSVQQTEGYNYPVPAANGFPATAAANRLPPHHLADTPAANYLRQQGYREPSPFNTSPLPVGWQMPSHHRHQQTAHTVQHLESLGCFRPIPRRIVPTNGERSVPEATLRAIGLSSDTNASSHEAHTDRLDLLISAIDQSENIGRGFGEWEANNNHDGSLKEPNSPASVNTLQGSQSPTASAGGGGGGDALVASFIREAAPGADLMTNGDRSGRISPAPVIVPVVLQAKPAVSPPTPPSSMLPDALAQLTNSTDGNGPSAVHSLVEILSAHPELTLQFKQLLSQPQEPTAFTEQHPVKYQQQQQQHSSYMQERPAIASNEEDLLINLLQRQQQLQKMANSVDLNGGGAHATATAAALRRAQLSVKFQAMQAKLAARQTALQKLQNHMEYQNTYAGQQQQQQQPSMTRASPPPITLASLPPTAGFNPALAISVATGDVNPTFSGNISTNNADQTAGAGQSERREALFRLLAAKLQSHKQQ